MQNRIIKHSLPGFIKAGIQTGFLVSVVNLLWYFFSVKLLKITGQDIINPLSVVISCLVAALGAALIFYFIFNRIKKPVLSFRGIVFVLAIASLAMSFRGTLPDGSPVPDRFSVLSAPMHIFAGLFIGYFIPKFLKGD
ncbi:MAG: hypothetical protein H7X71_01400, partial [Chitinophagales bacterium]|nr:hypothetical protein [Chitinophagales bacterium]